MTISELTTRTKIKIGLAILIAVLFVLFILFNMEKVSVNLLIAEIEMRRSILLLLVAGGGFGLGWIASSFRARHQRHEQEEAAAKSESAVKD
ncbi:MAG: putative integral membrane protein [Verrucomicrobiales bacterium]|jgi:uncharacterized integral membrane protein